MTFLNLTLLLGSLAALIPLAIYLFNRQRFQKVEWAAMQFLQGKHRENRRRIKIKRWLLILVRMAIPAFLALAMARPVLTGAAELTGESKTSMVILLDDSYSMKAGSATENYFSQAKAEAQNILQELPDGSEASVLLMGGNVRSLTENPTSDLTLIQKRLNQREAGFGRADVLAGLDQALRTLKQMKYTHKEVVMISDFQRKSWSPEHATKRKARVNNIRELSGHPFVNCIPVGGNSQQGNVAVTSLNTSRLAMGVGQKVHIRATVQNFGDEIFNGVRLYFQVDGEDRSASQISLDPGEEQQVLFTHTFDQPGSHTVTVHAEADRLKVDNEKTASLKVWDTIPVMLVNGAPSNEPLRGETDFLSIALGPFGLSRQGESKDLMEVHEIKPEELDGKTFTRSKVLVLANVSSLQDKQVENLKSYLGKGNGLLIFPGDKVDVNWYNKKIFSQDKLLPMRFMDRLGQEGNEAKVMAENYDHPALELFNDPQNGKLSSIHVSSWYRLGFRNASEAEGNQVLARLNTGDPFLAERSFKDGRIIQASIPADSDWSNMPVKPVYVPFMQQLVTYLASEIYPPRNVGVGETIMAVLPASMAGEDVRLTGPNGLETKRPVQQKEHEAVTRFTGTTQPGTYTLHLPDENKIHYVVTTDREESDLERLTEAQISSTVESMNASLSGSASEYVELTGERRFGREIWQMVALALLGLLFVEILLQQSLGGNQN